MTGGGRPAGLDSGFYFEPTILTEVTPDATIAQEEVFGPVLSVLRYSDDDDAVRIANNSQYGAFRCGVGNRRGPCGRGRSPGAHRTDRGERIRARRCAFRGVQSERVRPGKRRNHRNSSVHGAEGHGIAGVSLPLDGLRVVEVANEISGPYCGKLFADLGADVTKIEGPEGDSLRRWGPFPGGKPDPDRCGMFEYLNGGKRSVVARHHVCKPGGGRTRADRRRRCPDRRAGSRGPRRIRAGRRGATRHQPEPGRGARLELRAARAVSNT